jgi:hypothetical protein
MRKGQKKRDVYYQIEDDGGEGVGDVDCVEMNEDAQINEFLKRVKTERRALTGVVSEDVEVEFVSVEEKEKVGLLFFFYHDAM